MSNVWDDMRAAVSQSESTLKAADSVSTEMAKLLVGRLRFCSSRTLATLKRELREFDSVRRSWKA